MSLWLGWGMKWGQGSLTYFTDGMSRIAIFSPWLLHTEEREQITWTLLWGLKLVETPSEWISSYWQTINKHSHKRRGAHKSFITGFTGLTEQQTHRTENHTKYTSKLWQLMGQKQHLMDLFDWTAYLCVCDYNELNSIQIEKGPLLSKLLIIIFV